MTDIVDPEVESYATEHTTAPPEFLEALATDLRATLQSPGMMVGRLEGRFLEMLTFALGARSVLEIGTFGGYSALSMAAGLAPGGRITSCEISPTHAEFARRHIAASPYADRIEVILGPAIDTIATVDGPFDLVFIDADKAAYPDYYEAVLPKLAPGGPPSVQRRPGRRPPGGGGPDHGQGRGHPHPPGRLNGPGTGQTCSTTTSICGPTRRVTPRPRWNRWRPTASAPSRPG
jgi:caffeoyl-CoA O-methyltransferase